MLTHVQEDACDFRVAFTDALAESLSTADAPSDGAPEFHMRAHFSGPGMKGSFLISKLLAKHGCKYLRMRVERIIFELKASCRTRMHGQRAAVCAPSEAASGVKALAQICGYRIQ